MQIAIVILVFGVLFDTTSPQTTSHGWWTLAAVKPNVFAIEDQLKPFPCEAFRDTLTASQYDLCRQDNYLMSAVVSGTHKALYTCQRLFEGCIWNCSVNEKDHLLGSAIEATANKEREFVRMLLAAFITYDVSQECIKHRLADCECDFSIPFVSRDSERNQIFGGCGANLKWASNITRTVMGVTDDPLIQHNIETGIHLASKTSVHCENLGPLRTKSIRKCYVAINPNDFYPFRPGLTRVQSGQLVKRLKSKYENAIRTEDTGGLVPVNGGDLPASSNLVFANDSPNFCVANTSGGIPGPSGRQCSPSIQPDPHECPSCSQCNSCIVLCCNRGHYKKTEPVVTSVPRPVSVNGKIKVVIERRISEETRYFCN